LDIQVVHIAGCDDAGDRICANYFYPLSFLDVNFT
jgi:hypothetical protein